MPLQPEIDGQVRHRRGVTIIELLVSVALTLVVILAIVRVFDLLGGNVTQSRSILELSAQMRNVSAQIQADLDRITADPAPLRHSATAMGYFEIIEGPRNQRDNDGDGVLDAEETDPLNVTLVDGNTQSSILNTRLTTLANAAPLRGVDVYLQQTRGVLGDTDDVFMATIRSEGEPFVGRLYNPVTRGHIVVQSYVAEVVYWLAPIQLNNQFGEFALIRRIFLVQPEVPGGDLTALTNAMTVASTADIQKWMAISDVSMRPDFNLTNPAVGITMRANTLADLQIRRHRFAHWPSNFSLLANSNQLVSRRATFPDRLNAFYLMRSGENEANYLIPDGNDVLAQDLLSFDLRVFDPLAPVYRPGASRYVLTPQDPGFYIDMASKRPPANVPAANYGAYVDLGYAYRLALNTRIGLPTVLIPSHFSELPHYKSGIYNSGLTPPEFACAYDTWTEEYETDGIDQTPQTFPPVPGVGVADEGRNGTEESLINGNASGQNSNIVDDFNERETLPPYNHPLQGMEVVLRMRDVSSNQVRQASVVTDFEN